MAISPAHRFGQEIGLLLEEIIKPLLAEFTHRHDLYLDAKGPRGAARPGNKVTWTDKYGNTHDLDFVIERDGTADQRGRPLAVDLGDAAQADQRGRGARSGHGGARRVAPASGFGVAH